MTAYEQSMAELVRRVEALEDRRNEHFAEQTARIVAGPPDAAELKRQDRWHATRDAYVMGMAAAGEISGEFILEQATKCADLAHGPLEQKAPIVETYNMTAAYVAEVNALVKAADNAKRCRSESLGVCRMCRDRLAEALQPFEVTQ